MLWVGFLGEQNAQIRRRFLRHHAKNATFDAVDLDHGIVWVKSAVRDCLGGKMLAKESLPLSVRQRDAVCRDFEVNQTIRFARGIGKGKEFRRTAEYCSVARQHFSV